MMVSIWFCCISVTFHVYNHHLELLVKMTRATAPRGRTIYGHYPLSYLGQSKFLFNMEKERLSRMGVNFISWIKPVGFVDT